MKTTSVLNIAHRGARSLAPENTLAAAQKALETGAEMWELDVAMSADGVLFLNHDDTLVRTSNVKAVFPERRPWRVADFTLAEIRQLDFGSWFNRQDPFGQIAAGQVSAADLARYAGEPAPTLAEALAFTRQHHWRVNVEIKDLSGAAGDVDVVEKAVALIEELQMDDRVLLSSFNHRYLQRVKAANPRLNTAALVSRPGLKPAALLKRLGAKGYHPSYVAAVWPGAIANLRARGFEVNVWTVNDERKMRRLIKAGVSGIITDFPQRLRQLLQGR
ncbi:MAG: glycerophosphodiester phosphodiesterase family protein [Chloroflexota bacterium]